MKLTRLALATAAALAFFSPVALTLGSTVAFAAPAACGVGHPGWQRPGGYCEIAADPHSAFHNTAFQAPPKPKP